MLRKLLLLIVFVGLTCNAIAQSLRGTVTDKTTGESIPMANVIVKKGQTIVQGGATDFDGNYVISPLSPGSYSVEFSFIGYTTRTFSGVSISPSKATSLNVKLSEASDVLDAVELVVETYEAPIIDPYKQGKTIGKAEIAEKAVRSVGGLAAQTGGVAQVDQGGALTVRGGRSDQTVYFVDGVKVLGTPNISNNAMDQVQVITGGVPAEYGDVTSGVISITTRGPSSNVFGGVEFQTSEYLDAYGYNLAEFYYSTPLLWKNEEKTQALLGVFLSGNLTTVKDQAYTRYAYKLKDDVQKEIEKNPLILSRGPSGISSNYALNYIDKDDLESIDRSLNNASRRISLQTKFTLQTSKTSNMKFGGNFSLSNSEGGSRSIFNTINGSFTETSSLLVYADYQQFFENGEGANKGTIENAYYNIHADYSLQRQNAGDKDHGDSYWKYGYVGTFTPEYSKIGRRNFEINERVNFVNNVTGENEAITVNRSDLKGFDNVVFDNNYDILHYDFQAANFNTNRGNYTSQFYDYATDAEEVDLFAMQGQGALLNGGNPSNIYSLWSATGSRATGASKFEREQFRLTGAASGTIKGHELKIGFEFEQRTRRFWGVNASGMWGAARILENRHLTEASEFTYEYNGDVNDNNQLVLSAIPVIDESSITGYARNIRNLTGNRLVDAVSTDGMNVNDLSIDLFSQEELLNNGITGGSYGYDLYGNKITGSQPGVNEYLTDSLSNGDLKREVGAFQPIYMAGYIQDKFFVKDLVFNVGVRIDRYDANQEVLKDPYSIFDVKTAGEIDFNTFANGNFTKPGNIGDNYVVYVNDDSDPTAINGYRNGSTWYNAQGVEISDPNLIAAGTGLATPLLQDDARDGLLINSGLNDNGFTDYTPQITVMPRVSFNFPINDQALFFAHYDILTQRPTPSQSRLNPNDYLNLAQGERVGNLTNPNLKPQKTTDFELGFKQALTKTTALEVGMFYREMRDMIQLAQVTQAYPQTYSHFSNRDFGTVKGMTIKYEMRKVKNFAFDINYTLQFADGTGSSAGSAATLISINKPDLVTYLPLSFDQRHQFTANAVYSHGKGKYYDGPEELKKVLSGLSVSLTGTAASGRPYTQFTEANPIGNGGADPTVKGQPFGSRLPFNYRLDLKLTKRFDVNLSKKTKKKNPMSVYLQVNNLFNTNNILGVYGFTGNHDDDGYLNSAAGQTNIATQLDPGTYELLYGIRADNPFNLSRPRTIRLGLTLGF